MKIFIDIFKKKNEKKIRPFEIIVGPTGMGKSRHMITPLLLGIPHPWDNLDNCKYCNESHPIMEDKEGNLNSFEWKDEFLQLRCTKCKRTTPYGTVSEVRGYWEKGIFKKQLRKEREDKICK